MIAPLQHQNVAKYMCLTHVLRWCYTRRFATTIFSATRRCNIVSKNGYNIVPTNRRCESSRVTSSLGRCLVYIDQTFDKECHIYNFFKRIAFIIGSILSYLMRHLTWTTQTLPYFTFQRSFLTLLSMCRLFERLQAAWILSGNVRGYCDLKTLGQSLRRNTSMPLECGSWITHFRSELRVISSESSHVTTTGCSISTPPQTTVYETTPWARWECWEEHARVTTPKQPDVSLSSISATLANWNIKR